MDVWHGLRTLWRHKLLVALACVVGATIGVVTTYDVEFSPLGVKGRGIEFGVASASMVVDTRASPLGNADVDITPIAQRANLLIAQLSGDQARGLVATALRVPLEDVSIAAPSVDDSARTGTGRAVQLVRERATYKAVLEAAEGSPVIDVQTQAPTPQEAARMASTVIEVGGRFVSRALPRASRRDFQVVLRPLAEPVAGRVNPGSNVQAAVGIGLASAVLLTYLLLFVARSIDNARSARTQPADAVVVAASSVQPARADDAAPLQSGEALRDQR